MKYCRINLEKTNYTQTLNWKHITIPDIDELESIYTKYCRHKKFESVMPIFRGQYFDNVVIGYYDKEELVAFSLIHRYDSYNAECLQFAWDYENPKLRLGIESLKNECSVMKEWGFKYLYLGFADEYKQQLDGFEILGPI